MYEHAKKWIKKIIPESLINANEDVLRKVVSITFIGKNHECNICNFKMRKFIKLSNGNQLCPRCGSLPRTRRLYWILKEKMDLLSKRILHFSPPKSLAKKLQSDFRENYVTTDFAGEFKAQKQIDITNTKEKDGAYDVIICYHVLEHIEEDSLAMKELYRTLSKGGFCIVQTPFRKGDIYEDFTITSPDQRLIHFGQEDHVRIYSAEGLAQRLKSAEFSTSIMNFAEDQLNYFGFKEREIVIIAEKR